MVSVFSCHRMLEGLQEVLKCKTWTGLSVFQLGPNGTYGKFIWERVTVVSQPERHAWEEKRSRNTGRKTDLINFQIRHCFQWGCWVLTGSSEGAGTERKEGEGKGREDKENEEQWVNTNGEGRKHGGRLERGMKAERQGCVLAIVGEKDGEEGNVNEVTYLLISNELRLRVFNENVWVLPFPACECVHLTVGEK